MMEEKHAIWCGNCCSYHLPGQLCATPATQEASAGSMQLSPETWDDFYSKYEDKCLHREEIGPATTAICRKPKGHAGYHSDFHTEWPAAQPAVAQELLPATPEDIAAQREAWGRSAAMRGERQAVAQAPEGEIPPMDVQNDDVLAALAYIRGVPEDEEAAVTRVRLQNMYSRVLCRERQLRTTQSALKEARELGGKLAVAAGKYRTELAAEREARQNAEAQKQQAYNSGLASALNVVDTVASRFDRDTETMGALNTIQEAIRAIATPSQPTTASKGGTEGEGR